MLKHLDSSFSRRLLQWYDRNARDLPWRRSSDPYHIWISEIMLQQTTVKAVLGYYERWLKEFPDIKTVAEADIGTILKAWQGLGYYTRARNIHQAAQIILSTYDGEVPSDVERLKKIPGFGPYTLAAVLSIAFHKPIPVVDANVRRVVLRLAAIKENPGSGFDLKTQNSLSGIISLKRPGDFNQAMMELGATVCRSKEPVCNLCPVRNMCLAFKAGIQETIPQPKTTATINIRAVVGLITNNQKEIFIQKRPEKGLLAGLWEFPGGKVETGESLTTALKRELKEELDLDPEDLTVGQELCSVTHYYTKFRVRLSAFSCKIKEGARLVAANEGQWVKLSRLNEYPMPSGSAKILDYLGSGKHGQNFL